MLNSKFKFFSISTLGLMLLFGSCEQTLTEEPQSIISPDAFFKTADQCRQATNGVYSHLPGIFNQTGFWSVTMAGTDLFMNQGGNATIERSEEHTSELQSHA